jgi:transposase
MSKRKRHTAEQIVKKLRDADAMLAAGKSVGEVLQALAVSEATLSRWRSKYGGKQLKPPTDEGGKRLQAVVKHRSQAAQNFGG